MKKRPLLAESFQDAPSEHVLGCFFLQNSAVSESEHMIPYPTEREDSRNTPACEERITESKATGNAMAIRVSQVIQGTSSL